MVSGVNSDSYSSSKRSVIRKKFTLTGTEEIIFFVCLEIQLWKNFLMCLSLPTERETFLPATSGGQTNLLEGLEHSQKMWLTQVFINIFLDIPVMTQITVFTGRIQICVEQ
jgi:hypothetical protein